MNPSPCSRLYLSILNHSIHRNADLSKQDKNILKLILPSGKLKTFNIFASIFTSLSPHCKKTAHVMNRVIQDRQNV